MLDREAVPDGDVWRLSLDQGAVEFVAAKASEVEGLARIDLRATDRARAGETFPLAGVDFRLV